jgi:hypothetical protein
MHFTTILLGGAPNANWIPLLLVLIGIIAIIKCIGWTYQFVRTKLRKHKTD